MKSYDAFSGLSWGNLSRYKERNDSTIRTQRAAELDKRILAIANQTRSVEWAKSALDFCDREEKQNKDVFSLSKEAYRITEMQKEAHLILANEKSRIDSENKSLAEKTDAIIQNLSSAPRSIYWAKEVSEVDSEIQSMPRESRVLLKKLSTLQALIKEAEIIKTADSIDAQIIKLLNDKNKNADWITKVEELKKSITPKIHSLLKEQDAYKNLEAELMKAIRKPIFTKYSSSLTDVETGKWKNEQVRVTFGSLDADLKNHKFSMDEYISEFSTRWATARTTVKAENQRVADELAAKARAEQHARNMESAKPYISVLSQIEAGRADNRLIRDEFDKLDGTLKNLNFSISSCIDNFTNRWSAAKAKVANAKAEALRIEREAREAEERRKKEEERRRQAAEAERLERERKIRAARKRKEAAKMAFLYILGYIVPVGFMFAALCLLISTDNYWYAPIVTGLTALIFIHITCTEDDTMYKIYQIFGQVILYAATIGLFLLLEFGIFNMIVSLAACAIMLNVYPRYMFGIDTYIRMFQAFACAGVVSIMVSGPDHLLKYLLESSLESGSESGYWHTLWVAPLAIAITFILASLALHTDYDDDAEFAFMLTTTLLIALAILIKSFIVLFSLVSFSFGMFFFSVLLIGAAVAVWCICLAIMMDRFGLVI